MTKKERVITALNHEEADKVPKGELMIEAQLTEALIGKEKFECSTPFERDKAVRELLGMDLMFVNEYPTKKVGETGNGERILQSAFGDKFIDVGRSTKMLEPMLENIEEADLYQIPDFNWCPTERLDECVQNTDFFVVAQIGGPASNTYISLGMEDYMVYSMTNTEEIGVLGEKIMEYEIARAKKFIDHGADAILVADDIAFNSGLLLPPRIMDQIVFPLQKRAVQEIKKYKNVPVFFHSDGYLYDVLDKIIDCGFDLIQSLQPSAGMDIEKVKKNYGKDICLMGNVDLNYLLTFGTPEEVEAEVKRVIDIAAPEGGFILSTCNILVDAVKPENALAMYRTAEKYGKY